MSLRSPLAPIVDLFRHEPRARPFFVAHAQSALGNGAAIVALLVLAHERFPSPWAITLILLADVVPPMVLGPILGAAADRWSRRRCAVAADCVRAVAFLGIALLPGFETMLAFALVAGMGTALFRPATLAGLPSLVHPDRLPAATSLYGALDDLGYTLGPALAAAVLLLAGAESVMIANGATFAISALVLARLSFWGASRPPGDAPASLLSEARDGARAAAHIPGVPTLILASSGIVLFAGLFNVGELLLANDELGAGSSGYAILVAIFGAGIAAGSLAGARGGAPGRLKLGYLAGLMLTGTAFLACAIAPNLGAAIPAFALGGVGNGLVLVHERLLLQAMVPDDLMGRVFGVKDTLQSWAFAPSFIVAGALVSLLGTRTLFLLAGTGVLAVWCGAALALRATRSDGREASPPPAALRPALADS